MKIIARKTLAGLLLLKPSFFFLLGHLTNYGLIFKQKT